MSAILELSHTELQEILISSRQGRKLVLHLGRFGNGFRVSGEYYEPTDSVWYSVAFSLEPVVDAPALFESVLSGVSHAMAARSDSITTIHNVCNARFLTAAEQERILSRLSIDARVSVN